MSLRSLFFVAAVSLTALAGCSGNANQDDIQTDTTDARLVIDYRYGDAITRSGIRIFDNGVVVRTEAHCCPSRLEPVIAPPLSADQVQTLIADIDELSQAQIHVEEKDEDDSHVKDPSGELVAFDSSGKKVTIRAVARAPYRFQANASPKSKKIVDLVNGLARQKMPR